MVAAILATTVAALAIIAVEDLVKAGRFDARADLLAVESAPVRGLLTTELVRLEDYAENPTSPALSEFRRAVAETEAAIVRLEDHLLDAYSFRFQEVSWAVDDVRFEHEGWVEIVASHAERALAAGRPRRARAVVARNAPSWAEDFAATSVELARETKAARMSTADDVAASKQRLLATGGAGALLAAVAWLLALAARRFPVPVTPLFQTLVGAPPPLGRSALGWPLRILGSGLVGLATALGFSEYGVLQSSLPAAGKIGLGLALAGGVGVLGFLGLLAWMRGKELLAPVMAAAAARDRRRPVIYLRTFTDDSGAALGLPTSALYVRTYTEEEQLAMVMSRIGPFVAIAREGDSHFGAARFHLPEDDWQERVAALIGEAQLVILRVGNSASLRWEFEQARATVEPERLLLLLPSSRGAYAAFRSRADALVPRPLPDFPEESKAHQFSRLPRGAVSFAPDWTPMLVRFDYERKDTGRPKDVMRVFLSSLRPVVDRIGVPWYRWLPWTTDTLKTVAASCLGLALVGVMVVKLVELLNGPW